MESKINKESIAKMAKAAIIVAGMMGYNVTPEQVQAIVELAGGGITLVYIIESIWKMKKN